MNDKVEGIVLSQSDYRENDVLMKVLCKDLGIISLIGKASKKINSKNHFLPFCVYEFIIDYKDNKTIYTIHGSKLLANYFEDKDIVMMSYKNVLAEIVLKNPDIDTYNELLFVLKNINTNNMYLLGSMFISHVIKNFGISPMVDGCALCGNSKVVGLSNKHGGFLCIDHIGNEDVLDVDTLRKFRLMIKGSFEHYDVLKDFKYNKKDFDLLMNFYIHNSDVYLKAYDFYSNVV